MLPSSAFLELQRSGVSQSESARLAALYVYLNILTKISSFVLFSLPYTYHRRYRLTYLLDLHTSLELMCAKPAKKQNTIAQKNVCKYPLTQDFILQQLERCKAEHLEVISSETAPSWPMAPSVRTSEDEKNNSGQARGAGPGKARVSHEAQTRRARRHGHPATAKLSPAGCEWLLYSATHFSDWSVSLQPTCRIPS